MWQTLQIMSAKENYKFLITNFTRLYKIQILLYKNIQ